MVALAHPPEARVVRRHGVVLVVPLCRALALAAVAGAGLLAGWPYLVAAPFALAAGASLVLRAAWRWERYRIVVTRDALVVVEGTVRRRSAAVPLALLGRVEVEQSVAGRVLGYGTVAAGDLELAYVPRPHELAGALAAPIVRLP